MAASVDAAMNRTRPILSLLLAGLLVPTAGAVLINLARGSDLHGFGFVAMFLFAAVSLPFSLTVSAATIWLRRRPPPRARPGVR
jgi:hypothetical protein